jgi:NAD(P)-dependent dehydrogenase (short-subunit alcohol dehydrogenase family)
MMPTALVTAGSAGLGAAAALLFAKRGYNVVINYNSDAQRADALVHDLHHASSLDASKQKFKAIKADLASRDDIIRLVKETVAFFSEGPDGSSALDAVFSNGGWTRIRNISDLEDNVDEDDWDRCFNMNVKSHLWLMHAAKPYLEEAEGAFVTTASLAGIKLSGSSLAYSVTKAAQVHLVKGLALAASPKVRVNTVCPGLLLTVSIHDLDPSR